MRKPRLAAPLLLAVTLTAQDSATERKLATIPEGVELSTTRTGPDGARVTARTRFASGAAGSFVVYGAGQPHRVRSIGSWRC